MRQALKDHSNWPTYPQLYINGELAGGCDIGARPLAGMLAGGCSSGDCSLPDPSFLECRSSTKPLPTRQTPLSSPPSVLRTKEGNTHP